MNEENLFGKGGIRLDIPDPRDILWGKDVGGDSAPFNWDVGYDVEKELSTVLGNLFKMTVKDQNGSSSCGGQAWSYYGQVLNVFHNKNTSERSAKFIYSQTFVGTGGSGGNENCNIVINQGWGLESDTPSYEKGLPAGESFYERPQDITQKAKDDAKLNKVLKYANVLNRDADAVAQAIRDNHGCIFGLTGTNNGTWRSEFPLPPTTYNDSWNHWVYIGKCKMINGKKYFGLLNSWGTSVGDSGWQWISESYLNLLILGYPVIWSIWTMVEAENVVVVNPPQYVFTKLLKYGMKNSDVSHLQIKLGIKPVDGNFGPITLNAVKTLQKEHGLTPDGIVGKNTNAVLNSL